MYKKSFDIRKKPHYDIDSSDPEKVANYLKVFKYSIKSPRFDNQIKLPEIFSLPRFIVVNSQNIIGSS